MRVYEFAKKHEVSSKTLISLLAEQGFVVSSHMAVLPDQALEFLNKKFKEKSNVSAQEERNNLEAKQAISHTTPVKESVPLETKPVRTAPVQPVEKKSTYCAALYTFRFSRIAIKNNQRFDLGSVKVGYSFKQKSAIA
jgi:translation initiation factor IF-2